MPLSLVDLAPPAFTAPCRNQINEPDTLKGKRYAARFIPETGRIGVAGPG
jgi:hypothetical protein